MTGEIETAAGWWSGLWRRTMRATVVTESLAGRLLVLLGLTGFAISQPLFAVLGDYPAALSQAHVEGRWLVLFAVSVAMIPPLVLWIGEWITSRLSRRVADVVFLLMVGALTAMAVTQLATSRGVTSRTGLLAVGIGAFVAAPVAYLRYRPVADWVRYTAILPVIALAMFLFTSPAGQALLASPSDPDPVPGSGDHPPVVMIMLDELPTRTLVDERGRIDERLFPNLAAFANEATWYRRYTTMAPFTFAAVPSTLAGTLPTAQRPLSIHHPNTIFNLLAPTHEVNAIETATDLCSVSSCRPPASPDFAGVLETSIDVLGHRLSAESDLGLDQYAPTVESDAPDLGDIIAGREIGGRPESVQRFLEALAAPSTSDRPSFDYLHLMLPHQPWLFYPDGTLYRDGALFGGSVAEADRQFGPLWAEWTSTVGHQRHVLQTMYTDALLGEILDGVRATGAFDESLIVIVADHGISFEPRSSAREPSLATIGDIAFVPLLVKEPNQQAGVVSDRNLMSVDVLPTIADAVGVDIPWPVDGYPANAREISDRGSVKTWVDIVNAFAPRHLGTFDFEGREVDLRAGASTSSWDPLRPVDGLAELLDVTDVLGGPFDELSARPARGSVAIGDVEELREPGGGEPPLGVVAGVLEGHPDAADNSIFVLAVDGTIVTGSPVYADSDGELHVMAMLPAHALGRTNEIRAALVTILGAVELEIE